MQKRLVLLLIAVLAVPTLGQTLYEARSTFRKKDRADTLKERQIGIDAYVAAGDERGVKALLDAVEDTQKVIDKLDKLMTRKGRQINKIWKSVDKQMAAGRRISAGSIGGAEKEYLEVVRELDVLSKQLVLEERWQRALLQGAADLIGKLELPERDGWVETLARDASRGKDSERRHMISLLGRLEGGSAINALSELLLVSGEAELRVAAADALGALGNAKSLDVLGKAAMEDESWSVRIAAVQALGNASDGRAASFLVQALAKSEGRVVDDIVAGLENLSGRSFSDNATLWKEWYENEGTKLAEITRGLAKQRDIEALQSMEAIAAAGYLCGAARILDLLGLGTDEKEKALTGGLADSAREAVGKTLANVKKSRIRSRNAERLILRPYRATKDPERRKQFLSVLTEVSSPGARTALLAAGRSTDDEIAATAIRGLGTQREPQGTEAQPIRPIILPFLDDVLSSPGKPEKLKLAAIDALARRAGFDDSAREAVESLVRGLSGNSDAVSAKCVATLEKVTASKPGNDYAAWSDWWRERRDTFKPSAAVARIDEDDEGKDDKATTSFYGINTRSKHMMFILDRSASMTQGDAGDGKTRIAAAKDELIKAIRALPEDATFNIIFYNHEFAVWQKKMVEADARHKAAATRWIGRIQAAGNTNVFDPIEHAFKLAGRGTHDSAYGVVLDTIFFLSDGQPNRGRIVDPAQILAEVKRMNALKKVRLHTVGIGMGGGAAAMDPGQNASFMRRLAEITGGQYISR